MSSTIELTNNMIIKKILYLTDIADSIEKCNIFTSRNFKSEIAKLLEEYELGSIKILSDYFLLIKNYKQELKTEILDGSNKELFARKKMEFNDEKCKFFKLYQTFIKKENFLGKMDRICSLLRTVVQQAASKHLLSDVKLCNIGNIFNQYTNLTIVFTTNSIQYIKCPVCKKNMKLVSVTSEMTCTECGLSEVLMGTVFEDEQFYYQEGQRTKHGSYEPSKHCKFWIDRILARESKSIPISVIDDIKKCIKQNNIRNMEEISCEEIRRYLRCTKHTSYNEHVPLIRKIICGVSPPQLTDKEIQVIVLIFNKAKKIYEEVKPADKTNIKYYPYLIYKIIEHMLKDPSQKKRRNGILSCIHLQSVNTLISNDGIWQDVCSKLGIEYVPTDRNCDLNY